MKSIPFALLLIAVSAGYFMLRASTSLGDVPPLPIAAAAIGSLGIAIFLADLYSRIDRQLNRPPPPPFFTIDPTQACLEIAADGSYESCREFLSTLETHFQATYSEHMDAGPGPHSDKDKGYWNVSMFGQQFFVMRHRGYGLCISGPQPPADLQGFLRVADHFEAIEFRTWQQRLVRLHRTGV